MSMSKVWCDPCHILPQEKASGPQNAPGHMHMHMDMHMKEKAVRQQDQAAAVRGGVNLFTSWQRLLLLTISLIVQSLRHSRPHGISIQGSRESR